jgi:hypothetical protein
MADNWKSTFPVVEYVENKLLFTAFRIETTIVSVSQFEFSFLSIQYE